MVISKRVPDTPTPPFTEQRRACVGLKSNTSCQIKCMPSLYPNVLFRRSNYSDFYFLVNNHVCHNWFNRSKAPSWQSWRPEPTCQLRQRGCKQKLHEMEEEEGKKISYSHIDGGDQYVLFHSPSINTNSQTWPTHVNPLTIRLSTTDVASQFPENENNLFSRESVLKTGFFDIFLV